MPMVRVALLAAVATLCLTACGQSRPPTEPPVTGPDPDPGDDIPLSVPPLTGFLVNPYLQNPGPDRMTVLFEPEPASVGETMAVEYRMLGTQAFEAVAASPESIALLNPDRGTDLGQQVYAAQLTGLVSNTTYEYRVVTAAGTTSNMRFKTWPVASDGIERGRFLVISDIQGNNPDWLTRIFEYGVIPRDCDGDVLNCVDEFAGIIITGDLVDDGDNIDQWRDEYFAVGDSLFRYLPQLMIIGNHDYALANYLYYAAPPSNGSLGHDEEWYRLDYLNFRFLGLQSNLTVQGGAQQLLGQTAFITSEIADARAGGDIDYLIAGIHAPCKSELWLPGESIQVCAYVDMLEQLSADTGILTGHLFGHTHGYSRGQSRDVPHLWMNAASAGGRVDDWGDYAQADYDEFESTWDEYGYSVLEFSTVGAPEIRSLRRTGGDDHANYPNAFSAEVDRDAFTIGGDNTAPDAPTPRFPTGDQPFADILLHAGYSDADGDALHEAHWQLRAASGSFDAPLLDIWGNETRARNEWFRRDLNAGVDVDYWRVPYLETGEYCWRVRYRDARWAWSGFSDEACFAVIDTTVSDNLLVNGGAENGTEGWTVVSGRFESLNTLTAAPALLRVPPALCGLGVPSAGLNWFVLGGCVDRLDGGEAFDYSVVTQAVDLTAFTDAIAAGTATAVLRADLRNAAGDDVPVARFRVLDAGGDEIATSKPVINQTPTWSEQATSLPLPAGAVVAQVQLTGLRQEGAEGDAYIDNLRFNVVTVPAARPADAPHPVLSPGNGMALKPKKFIDP